MYSRPDFNATTAATSDSTSASSPSREHELCWTADSALAFAELTRDVATLPTKFCQRAADLCIKSSRELAPGAWPRRSAAPLAHVTQCEPSLLDLFASEVPLDATQLATYRRREGDLWSFLATFAKRVPLTFRHGNPVPPVAPGPRNSWSRRLSNKILLKSDADIFEFACYEDRELLKCCAIIEWLNGIFLATDEAAILPVASLADPNARTKLMSAELARTADENIFFETVFRILVTGDREKACKYATECKRSWLALIISGSVLHKLNIQSSSTDGSLRSVSAGNPKRMLWKEACIKLATQDKIGRYERATYSLLCGYLPGILPVCKSFELVFFAYATAFYEQAIDLYVFGVDNSKKSPIDLSNPEFSTVPRFNALTMNALIDALYQHNDFAVSGYLKSPFGVVLSQSLLENPLGALTYLRSARGVGDGCVNELSRFAAHYAMAFAAKRSTSTNSQQITLIAQMAESYIESILFLCDPCQPETQSRSFVDLKNRLLCVAPTYVRALQPSRREKYYARILELHSYDQWRSLLDAESLERAGCSGDPRRVTTELARGLAKRITSLNGTQPVRLKQVCECIRLLTQQLGSAVTLGALHKYYRTVNMLIRAVLISSLTLKEQRGSHSSAKSFEEDEEPTAHNVAAIIKLTKLPRKQLDFKVNNNDPFTGRNSRNHVIYEFLDYVRFASLVPEDSAVSSSHLPPQIAESFVDNGTALLLSADFMKFDSAKILRQIESSFNSAGFTTSQAKQQQRQQRRLSHRYAYDDAKEEEEEEEEEEMDEDEIENEEEEEESYVEDEENLDLKDYESLMQDTKQGLDDAEVICRKIIPSIAIDLLNALPHCRLKAGDKNRSFLAAKLAEAAAFRVTDIAKKSDNGASLKLLAATLSNELAYSILTYEAT